MKFKVETITPERARKLLDDTDASGFTNRSISKSRVAKFAHAIASGQWQVTHQGLALRPDGTVHDGQHRLHAIIMAGTPVDMLVVRDAEPDTFKVLDTGTARTTADSLRIAGYLNPNNVSAVVRSVITYQELAQTTENFGSRLRLVTTSDVVEFLDVEANRNAVESGIVVGRRVAGQLARYGLTSGIGITIGLVRLMPNELGNDTVAEFYARLGDGAMLEPSSPILALRRWFMSDTGYARVPGQYRRPVAVAATIKCMNDYALGRPRLLVQFKHGVEPYPAPLPKGSRRKYEKELEAGEAVVAAEG